MKPVDTAKITNQDDLIAFLDHLLADHSKNGASWENQDIESFIEAFQTWLGSSQYYYQNQGIDLASVTPWKEIGDAFAAARIYE